MNLGQARRRLSTMLLASLLAYSTATPADASKTLASVTQLDGISLTAITCITHDSHQLRACKFEGMDGEIDATLADYLHHPISITDILELKNRINQIYALQGFVNSGVSVPDQEIANNTLVLEVITGRIDAIEVSSALRNGYIRPRLSLAEPFNLTALQASLALLEQDPRITRIDARVAPGADIGHATLTLGVETKPTFNIGFAVGNNQAPSIGSNNATLTLGANNLTGWGDSISASVSTTRGLDANSLRFSVPVTASDVIISLEHTQNDSSVIEEPFADIDVESQTSSTRLSIDVPLMRSLDSTLSAGLILEARQNQTSLLGQSFSFSEGAIDGESRVAPVRLSVAYVTQGQSQSLAARLAISRGTNSFDATPESDQADGQFTSYLAQLQYSRMLTEQFYMTARLLTQYSPSTLLSVEKFALGGLGSVRGYRQNQIVRDSAVLGSIEGRYQVQQVPGLELVAFFDYGAAENASDAIAQGRDELSSIGTGISYQGFKGFSADVFFAHGFQNPEISHRDLQDRGVHLRLGYHYAF
jgi:hemolysin activation/secretion protein